MSSIVYTRSKPMEPGEHERTEMRSRPDGDRLILQRATEEQIEAVRDAFGLEPISRATYREEEAEAMGADPPAGKQGGGR